jgi:hypothetical protein
LHNTVLTSVADVAFNQILLLAISSINGDAWVVAIVHMVFGNQVTPRALLDFDPVALNAPSVINMVQRNDALAHDDIAVVASKVHSLGCPTAIVNGVSSNV